MELMISRSGAPMRAFPPILSYYVGMLATIRKLIDHQAWADSTILAAVRASPEAAQDETLRKTLHHIAGVQRPFLSLFLERPFDIQKEMQLPQTFDEMERGFREAHAEEIAFVNGLDDAGLARVFDMKWLPGLRLSVGDALMQVVMHSQSHRGQCASRLRALGVTPPMTDYIIWLKEHAEVSKSSSVQ
jgi:uncharacterized damage-inducible protein DinB